MKLIFLGTCAAGAPNIPEAELPEDRRRCASLYIEGGVVVDVAIQSFDFATKLGIDTAGVTDIFLSHAHADHYNKGALLAYAKNARQKLNFWCYKTSVAALHLTEEEQELVNVCPVDFMQEIETAGMRVKVLPANHANGDAIHFVFEKDGKTLYYGLDGAWFTPREWHYLNDGKKPLSALIIDATMPKEPINYINAGEHNNALLLPAVMRALKETGIAGEDTPIIADHIGTPYHHKGSSPERLAAMGYLPAYDGMVLEI